jgi:hypothetical protein
LANVLKSIKGKFSLSYYDFPLLHQWYPTYQYKWEKKEFAKAAAAKKGVTQNMGEELLIMNYTLNEDKVAVDIPKIEFGSQLSLF